MSRNNIKIIIVFLCVLIVGGVYMYVYKPNKDTTDSLKSETESLEKKLADLQEKNKHRDEYIEKTKAYYAEFDKIVQDFPATLDQELTVMFMKGIEDSQNGEFQIPSVGLGQPKQFYTLGGADGDYVCYTQSLPISYTGNYEGVKDYIDYIMNYQYRMNISSINISYDAENDVASGSVSMNAYAIAGGGREGDTLDLDVQTGVDNMFIGGDGAAANTNFAYDADNGEVIKTTNDIKITLNKAGNDTAAGVVVSAGADNTNVTSNDNDVVKVAVQIFEEDGKNYAKYAIGDKDYTVELVGKDVKIYVKSAARVDGDDKNSVKLNITNATKLPVFVKVDGDDAVSPRFSMGSKTGTVKVY
ncbi:MAG: hypothetical protein Q4D54_07020 [Eubacteriales bacterium]|nr:hypothetical protein [Lachnospiraceae bacterium]MDO5127481.1 hypothetical protein [Eubacteriales bacterium]